MTRRFVTLDVFTETPLTGNPLAVVLDAEGLDGAAMQAIAGEFNLSETVFVLPPDDPRHRARLRIFTPKAELPFAGHPTVGTAVLLALTDARAGLADAVAFGLEEGIGTLACVVEAGEGRGQARFRMPVLPDFVGDGPSREALAAALGLEPKSIGFGLHAPSRHRLGQTFLFVPLASSEALTRARLDPAALRRLGEPAALYLYTPDPAGHVRHFQARMFAPHLGVPEDPATGSAAAAFAGVMMQFEPMGEGTHDLVLHQGVAMGRPSEIRVQLAIDAGALHAVEVCGSAVIVMEGSLRV
ncbi:Trans-2,3-dihydro-3-hydroxyanthranilate isomerase [Methylobacterium adhaesivum]|jgi:trans-2,3-dihydro-3-hydroxyanthranilate isomerase|uniref:PhzF family phenazine biosynthesis protein n=1 Tax=Methylobacterium adhaesivum TaxID=333297 RepID=A0ABT8BK56_9HYPH|nr:PhzF family phenazine biosynthesis protein [Methylobacterium adhaesivum]MDN3592501.1 PhzF family phenazine biosynthesis protein [Methylobacterium adhaesivum]GJD32843.1 Trans-2,3-dihydro-3-hydroxyanthranilate isomerase [Methylobacterium adhaesivum]